MQLMGKLEGSGTTQAATPASAVAAATAMTQPPDGGPSATPRQQVDSAAPPAAPAAVQPEAAAGVDTAAPPDAAAGSNPLVVLLYGSPLAGTSTQATMLSSRYDLPVVTVDGLLHEAYSLQQAEASKAAATVAAATAAAAVTAATPGSPGRTQKKLQLVDQLAQLLFLSSTSTPADALLPASPTGRVQSAASSRSSAGGSHPEGQHTSIPELITSALKIALHQEQYSKGYIVDGLHSKHLSSAAVAARCLLQAVGLSCKALQPPEVVVPAPPAGSKASAAKAAPSRPPSSRPGVKGVPAAPEPVPLILTFSTPDVWEGSQRVSFLGGRGVAGSGGHLACGCTLLRACSCILTGKLTKHP